nr:MAG TPA: hypothetical protein [Caudoviricetes sp.]
MSVLCQHPHILFYSKNIKNRLRHVDYHYSDNQRPNGISTMNIKF